MNRAAAILTAICIVIAAVIVATTEPSMYDEPVSAARYAAECDGVDMNTESASVVSVTDDIITVKTESGELFAFIGTDFNVGNDVELLIDTNSTDNPEDDSVIDAILR